MGMTPDLLGCGQENEQVDDAVLQGAEVLQGEGRDSVARSGQSPLESLSPVPPRNARGTRAEVQCTQEPALMEEAGYELREGVSCGWGVTCHCEKLPSSTLSARMPQCSKPDP